MLEAGVTKRSAIKVSLIQASTVLRKENTITLTPTVIATATPSAATVTELRRSARERFLTASAFSTFTFCRCEGKHRSRCPAILLTRNRTRGTRKEKPERTKKAAPKLSQRGPTDSASQEKTAARKIDRSPATSQTRDGFTDRSSRVPPCRASIGSCLAAESAGNQAEATTDPRPITHAKARLHGRSAISLTFTSP